MMKRIVQSKITEKHMMMLEHIMMTVVEHNAMMRVEQYVVTVLQHMLMVEENIRMILGKAMLTRNASSTRTRLHPIVVAT